MKRSRRVWGVVYGVAIVIFIGGYLLGVQSSRYFPLFVLFCMAYGVAATALMVWPDRNPRKD